MFNPLNVSRILGVTLILLVLLVRGVPVLFFLKMLPLILILFVGVALIRGKTHI